jgi:threonine/homoserine/homoserine lactone efflux protein
VELTAFVVLTVVLVMTPGSGTAFLTDVVLQRGRRAGQLGAAGLFLGATVHAVAASAGLSVLLRRSPVAARVVAIAGGGYLVFLGVRSLYRLRRNARPGAAAVDHRREPGWEIVRDGVVTNLLNAPVALFYLVVVPQYIPPRMSLSGGMILLSAIHLACALTWTMTYATLLGSLVRYVTRPRVRMAMQGVTAVLLVALGARSMAG